MMQYVINAPAVVGEIIDDEAVILDLQSGLYFNTEASGAVIWAGIEHGATIEGLAERLAQRFDIALPQAIEQARAFVVTLQGHGLVRAEAAAPHAAATLQTATPREPFNAPRLGVHSDLDDLLRLDPIHDVDQAGWPMAQRHS